MNKPRLIDRLRYAIDNSLARGPAALVGWLAVALVTLVIIAYSFVALLWHGPPNTGYFYIFWNVLFQSIVPNPVDPAAGPWPFLLVMLLVTFCSLLLISTSLALSRPASTPASKSCAAAARGSSKPITRSSWAGPNRYSPSFPNWSRRT